MWQVLGQLLQPEPDNRFRTATGARKALAAAGEMLATDATAEQEVVEVFDHIGPLPAGFGPDGPLSAGSVTGAPEQSGAVAPSATGSFHLQPPQASFGVPGQPSTPPTPTPTPVPTPTSAPTAPLHPPLQQAPYGQTSATQPLAAHQQPGGRLQHSAQYGQAPVSPRKPGPPPKVAIPVLLVAVICLAIGIWALTAS
jgi:serine/threonine-protein kinase